MTSHLLLGARIACHARLWPWHGADATWDFSIMVGRDDQVIAVKGMYNHTPLDADAARGPAVRGVFAAVSGGCKP